MNFELETKREWEIEKVLMRLLGRNVRVLGRSFVPSFEDKFRWPIEAIKADRFWLPDNRSAEGCPVFFEGKLNEVHRSVGVIHLGLSEPDTKHFSDEGFFPFRGRLAVIMRGPVVVQLDYPFVVELLPSEPVNYWLDLRFPRAQFEFQFGFSQ